VVVGSRICLFYRLLDYCSVDRILSGSERQPHPTGRDYQNRNAHLRRVMVKAIMAYQHKFLGRSLSLLKRQQGLDQEIKDIARKAQWYRVHASRNSRRAARTKQSLSRPLTVNCWALLGYFRQNRTTTAAASCLKKLLPAVLGDTASRLDSHL
jgi:hypothetical protein